MHSFVLLALASSAFAIPVRNGVVNAPVDAKTPIGAVVNAAAGVVAPVKAAVGNVDANKVNVANELLSDNTLLRRGGPLDGVVNVPAHVVAPVKAAVDAVVKADAPVKAAVANANVKDVNAANDVLSNNYLGTRDGVLNAPVDIDAPVKAVVNAAGEVVAPIEAAVGNVNLKDIKGLNSIASKNVVARHNPTDSVVNAPVDAFAPVKAFVDAAAEVKAPIEAAVANANVKGVNAANGVASDNTVLKRGGLDGVLNAPVAVAAPVKALVDAAAKVEAPVKAAVANVNVKDANVANNIGSGNTIAKRNGGLEGIANAPALVKAPVDAVVNAFAKVDAPIKAAVGNVNAENVNAGNGILSGNYVAKRNGGLDGIANAPALVEAPVDAVVNAFAKVDAPIKAAVGNVNAENVNAGNGILSGNYVAKRNGGLEGIANAPALIKAPVDAVVNAFAKVDAPVKAAVGNVNAENVNAGNGILSGNYVAKRDGGLDGIVNAPAKVEAPVEALVNAAAKVVAPVTAAVGNVGLKNVNIGNGIASGNNVARQEGLAVPALPTVIGSTQANATKIVANIQGLLASTPAGSALAGPLSELNSLLTGAVGQLGALNGLGLSGILDAKDGEVEVSTQQAAQSVTDLTKTVSCAVQDVTAKLGDEVPELKPVVSLLNGSLNSLISTVTSLIPGVTPTLGALLTPISGTLNSAGVGFGLDAVGL